LKSGKDDADATVENALFRRACGYEVEEIETVVAKDGKARVRKTKKTIAPDVIAQIFYLKNRAPERWRDKQIREFSGVDGADIKIRLEREKELSEKSTEELHKILENRMSRLGRIDDLVGVGGSSDNKPERN